MMNTMKVSVLAALATLAVNLAHAGEYLTNFDAGKQKAAAENKNLLVKFTGSDWCPPCMKLEKDVFSKKSFQKGVEKDFVVVVLDFPRSSNLPKEARAANKKIAKKYKIKSYPTVMLMDSKGKVFKSMSGYDGSGPKAYLAGIKSSLKAKAFQ